MSDEIKQETEWMERMKEVQRIQYDYFKYLITLSTGSILILVAFLEKVFVSPDTCTMLFIFISMIAFSLTIVFSLLGLPNTGNMILYINGLQRATMDNDIHEAEKYSDKIDGALDGIKILGKGAFFSYASGIGMLLIGIAIYFFCQKI